MLIVQTNKAQYEYDIHSLVKAFYPEQEVKVLTPESVIKDRKIKELPAAITLDFRYTSSSETCRAYIHPSDNGRRYV